jgi:YidC/Oxa1 family membrane protein insertase
LSFLVILVWFVLFPPQEPVVDPNAPAATQTASAPTATAAAPDAASTTAAEITVAEAPRLKIDTPRLSGSISLQGGRIDALSLKDYRETIDDGSPNVELLTPLGEPEAYYALFAWAPGGELGFDDVPGPDTIWQVESGDQLEIGKPVTLIWQNTKGQTFHSKIEVDENFMFSVTQSVENSADGTARMAAYSQIRRHGEPSNRKKFFVIHEGPIRQTGKELTEFDYKDVRKLPADERWGANAEAVEVESNGWIGITDHYWMTTLIPQGTQPFTSVLKYDEPRDIYITEARLPAVDVAPGQSASYTTRLFAGAKEWSTIREYQNRDGIYRFIDAIDWGWFFFLTKPIFATLHWLNSVIGNMGWSILVLTLVLKAIVFPLAYKSYVSMARMKELQPEMEALKERAGDDRQKMQQGMMELYKKNKVNPASGCLPILLQIPIFFSLYKVIFVTIELRHAPWIGWIRDLSSPDPSSILNLFGLLPFATPEPGSIFFIFSLGILPILLGISMWLQQKLNPAPTDPTQAMIFAWMPWVFMFMLGSFASGLVLYWIANNTITFTQQYLIMRSHGHKPDVFGNILKSFRRKKPAEK